ncbi:MAG: SDR family NAD(P)-dependent oxidoreductase [Clostridium sp.]|nr:SDR family NAD(P)-dependent oxidoreductase [Clostridium sp.]
MFQNKVAVITGGAQGIGKTIAKEFKKKGAFVCIIDKQPNEYFIGNIDNELTLQQFAEKIIKDFGWTFQPQEA